MRPAHVFATPAADAESEIVALLQGPWRFALRLVMIWLSLRGLTAAEIAALFEYDSRTVRRRINRYNQEGVAGLEDRPRAGAPRLGSAGLGLRIRLLLRQPRAWTLGQLRRALGYPAMSLATLARRAREQARWRRPRLVAKGDPDEAAVLAALHHEIAALPEGAVLLAEDESHINLLLWLRSTSIVKGERQEVMTPGWRRRRLVERRPDPADRRIKQLVLTGEGRELRGRLQERLMRGPAPLVGLFRADQVALRDLLLRALDRERP